MLIRLFILIIFFFLAAVEGSNKNSLDHNDYIDRLMSKDSFIEKRCTYDLSIVAIFHNEAPYMREWIEYHKLLGVQHFYLFNQNSSDNFSEVLKPYIAKGELELIHWPQANQNSSNKGLWIDRQTEAVALATRKARGQSRWLASLDIDEFIVPINDKSILDVLKDYEAYGQLGLHWLLFGTSFVERIPDDQLLIETLVLCEAKPSSGSSELKSIFKPHRVSEVSHPLCLLNTPFETELFHPDAYPRLRINHYWTRDENYLLQVKCPRYEELTGTSLTKNEIHHLKTGYNEISDSSILRFVPDLKKILFKIP